MPLMHLNKDSVRREVYKKLIREKKILDTDFNSANLEKLLEQAVKEKTAPESIRQVLKTPFKKYVENMCYDLDYEELFKGSDKRKSRLNDLAVFLSFGYTAIPHEFIHAGTNKALGGVNQEIVMNKFFDFGISPYLFPGVESKLMIPLLGGYVKPDWSKINSAEHMLVAFAPYILTPIGIYLVQKGKENKSLPLAIAGSGAILAHGGGVIGDFLNFGTTTVSSCTEFVYNTLGGQNYQEFSNNIWLSMMVGSFFVGLKTATFSYRLFKAGVNSLRKTFD